MITQKICKRCGKGFQGGPRALYCPKCRKERLRERRKKYNANGSDRKIGSVDTCKCCGKQYTVSSGTQKYCKECAGLDVREIDKKQGLKWHGPKEIVMLYKGGNSINKIHELTGKSHSRIRKILITEGLWKDGLTVRVRQLLDEGKTQKEIAEILDKSENVINSRSPYTRGTYGWNQSQNALQIKQYRQNKKE